MGEGVEVWRGCVAAWECDVMGHLNVGFYAAKCMEGLVALTAALGLPRAFSPGSASTVVVLEQHSRFLSEAQAGAPLSIDAGVLELGEREAQFLFLFRDGRGELGASFLLRVTHAAARDGQPIAWPEVVRQRAGELRVALPGRAAPRSLPFRPFAVTASLQRANELGLQRIGLGAIRGDECDPFGRIRPERIMARLSDAIGQIFQVVEEPGKPRIGGAALEFRLIFLAWPGPGDRMEVRARATGGDVRSRRFAYWILDPLTGSPWALAENVAVLLDLDARTLVSFTPEEVAAWNANAIPGLV